MKPEKTNFYSLKKEIDELSLDPVTKLGLKLAFIILGLQFIALAVFWRQLPPQLPLWYSRAYGEDRLAESWHFIILPVSALIVELVSIKLAATVRTVNQLWSQLLSWAGSIAVFMAFITLIKIIFLIN